MDTAEVVFAAIGAITAGIGTIVAVAGHLRGHPPDGGHPPDMTASNPPPAPPTTASVPWSSPETRHLAAPWVREGLAGASNYGAEAVDSGVVLYRPSGFAQIELDSVDVHIERAETQLDLHDPEPEDLRPLIEQQVEPGVREYLLRRVDAQAADGPPSRKPNQGEFRTKVGLVQVDLPIGRTGTRFALHLAPLSYWVVSRFNRRMAKLWVTDKAEPDDPLLLRLREERLPGILASQQFVELTCPSPLYVELAVVTADRRLAVFKKKAPASVLASVSRAWTCSIEEGVEWRHIVEHVGFDATRVAADGAYQELAVQEHEIDAVWFSALGLEYTHLATGLLGTMVLTLTATELRSRVTGESPDFDDVRFVDVDYAVEALFPHDDGRPGSWSAETSWHPTARLRALLTLYRLHGRDVVLDEVVRRVAGPV